jgi:hypothetical protein
VPQNMASAITEFQSNETRGLDRNRFRLRMSVIAVFMQPNCMHTRTELIARRDGVDYVRCLDCDQVFESDDLEPAPVTGEDE